MEIVRTDMADISLLGVSGYIDADTAPALYDTLRALRAEGRQRVIIDCSGLTYISSQGIWAILKHALELRENGGDIRIASAPECVRLVISGLNLGKHLSLYGTAQEATVSFAA